MHAHSFPEPIQEDILGLLNHQKKIFGQCILYCKFSKSKKLVLISKYTQHKSNAQLKNEIPMLVYILNFFPLYLLAKKNHKRKQVYKIRPENCSIIQDLWSYETDQSCKLSGKAFPSSLNIFTCFIILKANSIKFR